MLRLKRAVVAVVACLLAGASTARADILIASIGPMTGPYASIGEQMRRGDWHSSKQRLSINESSRCHFGTINGEPWV